VKEQVEFTELCLGTDLGPAKSLRIKISRQTNRGTTIVGICYRLPDQEVVVDATFFRKLEEASCSQALLLTVEI